VGAHRFNERRKLRELEKTMTQEGVRLFAPNWVSPSGPKVEDAIRPGIRKAGEETCVRVKGADPKLKAKLDTELESNDGLRQLRRRKVLTKKKGANRLLIFLIRVRPPW